MAFDPELALIRFGSGLSPLVARPAGADSLLADVLGEDKMAMDFPIASFDATSPSYAALAFANRAEREARETPDAEAAREMRQVLRDQLPGQRFRNHKATFARAVAAPVGFRERLVAFWADHFTVKRRQMETLHLVSSFSEDAIRPYVAGSFREMLRAVVMHPMMLLYLEQVRSIGPQSAVGLQRGLGLNENLARELLELHLVGVGGTYSQADVRELAELLTGLTFGPRRGVYYEPRRAEPGAETVLGLQFGAEATLDTVLDALDSLAVLPQTAKHLAWKMAVHFISPDPDPGLVAAMADAFGPNGDLFAMMQAMLDHPAAWAPTREKVRLPFDYIVAGLRALGVTGEQVNTADRGTFRRVVARPMTVMGQPWHNPPGPDGWPEDAADWIIPQAMAARITWAMTIPMRILDDLPDPRDFVRTALGQTPPEEVVFAAAAAENRKEGVGVVLASAAFQRR